MRVHKKLFIEELELRALPTVVTAPVDDFNPAFTFTDTDGSAVSIYLRGYEAGVGVIDLKDSLGADMVNGQGTGYIGTITLLVSNETGFLDIQATGGTTAGTPVTTITDGGAGRTISAIEVAGPVGSIIVGTLNSRIRTTIPTGDIGSITISGSTTFQGAIQVGYDGAGGYEGDLTNFTLSNSTFGSGATIEADSITGTVTVSGNFEGHIDTSGNLANLTINGTGGLSGEVTVMGQITGDVLVNQGGISGAIRAFGGAFGLIDCETDLSGALYALSFHNIDIGHHAPCTGDVTAAATIESQTTIDSLIVHNRNWIPVPDYPAIAPGGIGNYEEHGLPFPEISVTDSLAPINDLLMPFGNVGMDGAGNILRTATFTITNDGSGTLTVLSVVLSDATHFQITNPPSGQFTLARYASRTFTVNYDPTAYGDHTATITVTNDDSNENPVVLDLSGRGTSPAVLTVEDSVLPIDDHDMDYGLVAMDGAGGIVATETFTIRNDGVDIGWGVADLWITSVTLANGTQYQITAGIPGTPFMLVGSASVVGTLTFDPLSLAVHTDTLTIVSDDFYNPTVDVAISGEGVLPPEIRVEETIGVPTDLRMPYGTVDIGGTRVEQVTIYNDGQLDLTITGFALGGGTDFNTPGLATPYTVPGFGSVVVNVSFDPIVIGVLTDTLTILSDDSDEGTINVALSGVGRGLPLPATIVVDPTTMNFNYVWNDGANGEFKTIDFSIANNSGSAITVGSIGVTDTTNFAVTIGGLPPATPFVLNDGESATCTVTFDPTVTGRFDGEMVSIAIDATYSSEITLLGVGFTPTILNAANTTLNYDDGDDLIQLLFKGLGEAWVCDVNGVAPNGTELGYVRFINTTDKSTFTVKDLDPDPLLTPNTMMVDIMETWTGENLGAIKFYNKGGTIDLTDITVQGYLKQLYVLGAATNWTIDVGGYLPKAQFLNGLDGGSIAVHGADLKGYGLGTFQAKLGPVNADVTVDGGGIKTFTITGGDYTGDFAVSGPVGFANLANLTIKGTKNKVTGNIDGGGFDGTLDVEGYLKKLSLTGGDLNTDVIVQGADLKGYGVGSIVVKAAKDAFGNLVGGNFNGAIDVQTGSLKTLSISGGDYDDGGGNVMVNGSLDNLTVKAMKDGLGDLAGGNFTAALVDILTYLKKLSITGGDFTTDVIAHGVDKSLNGIGAVTVKAMSDGGGFLFGGNLLGSLTADTGGAKSVSITGGDLLADLFVNGVFGGLTVKTALEKATETLFGGNIDDPVDGVNILVTGELKKLTANSINDALIAAGTVGTVKVTQDMTDSRLHAGGVVDWVTHGWTTPGHGNIKSVTIGGDMTDSDITAGVWYGADGAWGGGDDTVMGVVPELTSIITKVTVEGTIVWTPAARHGILAATDILAVEAVGNPILVESEDLPWPGLPFGPDDFIIAYGGGWEAA